MDAQCLCSVIHSGIEAAAKEDLQDTIPCNQGSPDLIEQALTTAINEDEFVTPEVLLNNCSSLCHFNVYIHAVPFSCVGQYTLSPDRNVAVLCTCVFV